MSPTFLGLMLHAPIMFQQQPGLPPNVGEGLLEWQSVHGPSWRVLIDEAGTMARTLYNGTATGTFQPLDDEQRYTLAREFLVEAWDMFGLDDDTLVSDRVQLLPLGTVGSTDKTVVRLRQEVLGVPVRGGSVHAILDEDDHLVCLDSEALPHASGFDVVPDVSPQTAQDFAELMFTWEHENPPEIVGTAQLAIAVHVRYGERRGVLVWEVAVEGSGGDGGEVGYVYQVCAEGTPEVIERESLYNDAFQASAVKKVKANVTDGFGADNGSNFSLKLMPYVYVRNSTGQNILDTTNANGEFSVPPTVTNVLLGFDGPYVNLCSYNAVCMGQPCCDTTGLCVNHTRLASLNPFGPSTVVVNPTYSPTVVAQANVSWAIGQMREWIRQANPMDNTFDLRAPYKARPNRFYDDEDIFDDNDCDCRAQYKRNANNDSLTFVWWTRGLPNQCSNHAFHTIIWHEMGHWMNDRYGSGNVGGFGEGNADAWALYISDQPILGPVKVDTPLGPPVVVQRSGENTRQFCGDCPRRRGCTDCLECHGESHADGEVLMGALWKVRESLKGTHGTSLGGAIANSLFLSWLTAFDVSRIRSVIRYQWLIMDDVDGILSNGTPNRDEINSGFDGQSFPPYQNPPVPNDCASCLFLDFRTNDDFQTKLANGQDVSALFGNFVTISASGPNEGPAIFDSSPFGPNASSDELDLLVGLGNVLVLQDDPTQTTHGIFDNPGDSVPGGTIQIDFNLPSSVFSIDLVDISSSAPANDVTIILTDDVSKQRTFVVPGGWTGNIATSGKPKYRTLQLSTLSDQPGFSATATASEDPGFRLDRVLRLEAVFSSEGALDNVVFCKVP